MWLWISGVHGNHKWERNWPEGLGEFEERQTVGEGVGKDMQIGTLTGTSLQAL